VASVTGRGGRDDFFNTPPRQASTNLPPCAAMAAMLIGPSGAPGSPGNAIMIRPLSLAVHANSASEFVAGRERGSDDDPGLPTGFLH